MMAQNQLWEKFLDCTWNALEALQKQKEYIVAVAHELAKSKFINLKTVHEACDTYLPTHLSTTKKELSKRIKAGLWRKLPEDALRSFDCKLMFFSLQFKESGNSGKVITEGFSENKGTPKLYDPKLSVTSHKK